MSTYLLLRDNKESGPYSLEDLRTKGLKAYDLVWIEGRSAAWRYPSEVEELRPFAPAVEEQPFDRFYKRTAQINAAADQINTVAAQNNSSSVIAQNNEAVTALASINTLSSSVPEKELSFASGMSGSVISAEPSSVPGKRIIYVTLPADKTASGMRMPSFREPARVPVSIPASTELRSQETRSETRLQETRTTASEKEPVRTELSSLYLNTTLVAEEKVSQTSGDMWKGAVELTPRQQSVGLKRLVQPLVAAVSVLALLAAGIFIGLSFNKNDSFGFSQKTVVKENPVAQAPVQTGSNRSVERTSPVTQTASIPAPDPNAPQNAAAAVNTQVVNTQNNGAGIAPPSNPASSVPAPADKNGSVPAQTAAPVLQKKKDKTKERSSVSNARNLAYPLPAKDSDVMGQPVMRREAIHRTDETNPSADALKSSISNMVSVGTGKYSVGTFGGISDLQLTVSNHSIYPLDLVVVEVQYIQSNKKVFKTENMYFRGIGPGAALMQEAPKSSRGIKIQYRITLINSKELGLSYSGI